MGFELPRVTRCCFCFPLRTGSLIIGYLSLTFMNTGFAQILTNSTLSAILMIVSFSFFTYLVAAFVRENKDNPPEGHTTGDVVQHSITLYIVFGCRILVFTFYFVISLLLVIGTHKNKPKYMRHYFITGMVNLVLNLVLVTVGFVFTGFLSTVSHLVSCAVMFYFLLVVRSTYLDMEEQKSAPPAYDMHLYSRQQAPLMP